MTKRKLTDEQVDEIRLVYDSSEEKYGKLSELARKYDVTAMTIHNIISKQSYVKLSPKEERGNGPSYCPACGKRALPISVHNPDTKDSQGLYVYTIRSYVGTPRFCDSACNQIWWKTQSKGWWVK